jgi:hypothetical protein
VRAEVASAESELDVLVNAPAGRGRDPFEWLPDELLVMVLVMVPLATLCSGACERVCQRWAKLMESSSPAVPIDRPKDFKAHCTSKFTWNSGNDEHASAECGDSHRSYGKHGRRG